MSRMAALVFLAAAATAAPSAASPQGPTQSGITAEQALANEHAALSGVLSRDGTPPSDCRQVREGEILVCRRQEVQSPRLPMREARAEPGEVVHHIGEPPANKELAPEGAHCRLNCEPSKLGETFGKAIGLLRSAITGEDRGF